MYEKFYGLKEKPFNVTSDPSFLYMSKQHREAFSYLLYGIKAKKGFIELTGEIGTGKTTLCRALLNEFDETIKTAFILNSNLPELQLLEAITNDFGIQVAKKTKINLLNALNGFLIEQLSHGYNVVLIIDEAQNLTNRLLEQVRLLSNLETDKEKLFQMILVGQPELRDKLNSSNLRQLRQRISVRYHILPLYKEEIFEYITHRLRVAGSNSSLQFTDEALDEIYNFSAGTPRLINILCDHALLLGYVLETKIINKDIIKKSITEIEGKNQ